MRIVAAKLHPYALPLKRPWIAARATLHERQGTLLALTDADGHTGWGDCAPLPSSGPDGHARVFEALAALAPALADTDAAAAWRRAATLTIPELRWALETAISDLEARRRNMPLAVLLGAKPPLPVAVNAALGVLDDHTAARAVKALEAGYTIAKLKVGVGTVEFETAALHALQAAIGGRLRLRLDANRAWTETEARRFLMAITDLPIDAVEEPLAQPTLQRLGALQRNLPYALAVDESLAQLGLEALLEDATVRRLVVKPARIGGITVTRELVDRARAAGIEVILTSVVDSAVGVTAAAHLAAAIAPDQAHGLATLDWLAADVAEPPRIRDGRLLLTDAPGLGFVPTEALAKPSVAWASRP